MKRVRGFLCELSKMTAVDCALIKEATESLTVRVRVGGIDAEQE